MFQLDRLTNETESVYTQQVAITACQVYIVVTKFYSCVLHHQNKVAEQIEM